MKAIILAAGMGTRLGKYTKDLPKGMLSFNGKTLIETQVETLRSCGIKDIVIVRGYIADKINIPDVKYYTNEDFSNTNMVETLFKAESEMDDDILICYSDIIYEKRVIEKVLSYDCDIGVVVDKDYLPYWRARLDNPEDDMESLVISSDEITELGDTDCKPDKAESRYVGIIKFSKVGIKILKEVYHKNKEKYHDKDEPWMKSSSFRKAYMTCLLQAIINENHKVKPIIIYHGWLEFDTDEDYEKYSRWLKEDSLKRFFTF